MDNILSNIEDYNNKKRRRKVLITFDDMISHVMSDITQQILKDLFIKCRKLNISLCC